MVISCFATNNNFISKTCRHFVAMYGAEVVPKVTVRILNTSKLSDKELSRVLTVNIGLSKITILVVKFFLYLRTLHNLEI